MASGLTAAARVFTEQTFESKHVALARAYLATLTTRTKESSGALADRALWEMLLPAGHPRRASLPVSPSILEHIDADALQKFHHAHVAPSRVTVVAVGDVDTDGFVKLAESSSWRSSWAAMSGRLGMKLRGEHGYTYGVHAGVSAARSGGTIRVTAAVETARAAESLGHLLAEIESVKTEPIDPVELARCHGGPRRDRRPRPDRELRGRTATSTELLHRRRSPARRGQVPAA